VSNLRLIGQSDCYVIDSRFWDDLLEWAEESGWKPEHPSVLYRTDSGLHVTDSDADRLADTLEFIAGDIVLHELDVSDEFLRELLDGLLKLTIFFQSGGFRIC